MSWVYLLTGNMEDEGIDDDVANSFMERAYNAHVEDEAEPWQIVINCKGGDMESTAAIFDTIRGHSHLGGGTHRVTTVIRGKAYSGGALVAQAGDVRLCGPTSLWMWHQPHGCVHGTLKAQKRELDVMQQWNRVAAGIFAERSNFSADEMLDDISMGDVWLTADQLLSRGLVDGVA